MFVDDSGVSQCRSTEMCVFLPKCGGQLLYLAKNMCIEPISSLWERRERIDYSSYVEQREIK